MRRSARSDQAALAAIEARGAIFDADRARFPGLHFCADFDFLLIWNGDAESAYCHCGEPPSPRDPEEPWPPF